jgi:hypothetical protein
MNDMPGERCVSGPINRQTNEPKGVPKHQILGCQPCALLIRDGSLTVSLPISTAC